MSITDDNETISNDTENDAKCCIDCNSNVKSNSTTSDVQDDTVYEYVLTRADWIQSIDAYDSTICRYIDILGVRYKILITSDYDAFPKLKLDMDAYTDTTIKEIVVDGFKNSVKDINSVSDIYKYICDLIRHEVVHSFLYESGLGGCCDWANEEMVDWVAIQLPKFIESLSNIKE